GTGDSGGAGEPVIVAPVPGTKLPGDTVTFQWDENGMTDGTNVIEWWLYVGTSPGGNDLYDSGSLGSNILSATVSSLPTDGSTVWVRLWYDSNHWHDIDFQYRTGSGGGGTDDGGSTSTGSFNVGWTAPVARTDGAPLSLADIDGYRIYYGESADTYTYSVNITDGTAQSATVKDVPEGNYYVVMTTYDVSGLESGYSKVVTKTAQ
ncbi:MAG: hypothetical protein U9P11_02105, partial [Pseudomonadota bacterium]|nr:hypothetical protein [Pseudomonadota bacterium]